MQPPVSQDFFERFPSWRRRYMKTRKARKDHVCSVCRDCIKSGDEYLHLTTFAGDEYGSAKFCFQCASSEPERRFYQEYYDEFPSDEKDNMTLRKARKSHTCSVCRGAIQARQHYYVLTTHPEHGVHATGKFCRRCAGDPDE